MRSIFCKNVVCFFAFFFFCVSINAGTTTDFRQNEEQLSTLEAIYVEQFVFRGNELFQDSQLSEIAKPYVKRNISAGELENLRLALSRFYVDKGYINSGVILPDQKVEQGSIVFLIIEGNITNIIISGNLSLRSEYIESRLKLATGKKGKPFNINELQKRLKLLKQDPRIENINAVVSPGLKAGEANLKVEIVEAKPYELTLKGNNYGSPSIGAYRMETTLNHYNLTGWGDTLNVDYIKMDGLDNYSLKYTWTLNEYDTAISLIYSKSNSIITASPFDIIDIENETKTVGCALKHPLYKNLTSEFSMELKLERQLNRTSLFGIPFSFTNHIDDSKIKVTVLSFSQEFVKRSLSYVIACNSDIRFGLDLLDSTVHTSEYADSRYVSWLGQFQLFNRFQTLDSSVLFKTIMQVSNDQLLSIKKLSIGGSHTVRGYRESQITADSGIVSSLEWRIPIGNLKLLDLSEKKNDGKIELCPFFDFGKGWNKNSDSSLRSLSSLGIVVRWQINENFDFSFHYGHALREIAPKEEYVLQDNGIQFQLKFELF